MQPPKYTMSHLQEFIQLSQHFNNDVKEVVVNEDVITWYQEQVKMVAKNLNIPTTKNNKESMYMGIKLVCAPKLKTK